MTRPPTLPAVLSLAALCAASLLPAGLAQAQSSPWYIGASQTLTHESNVLRLGDGQATPAGFSRSDTISSTALIAGLDQPIGRQRLYGNVALRRNTLSRNSVYDNDGYTLAAGLDWSTIERLSGSLNLSSTRRLGSNNAEEIGFLRQRNLETSTGFDATVRVGLVTQWTAELGAGYRDIDNSLEQRNVQARNFRQQTASAGVRWRPSTVSDFGLALRATSGEYPRFDVAANGNFIGDKFKRQDIDLTANYRPSSISNFDARISLGQVSYDRATQRDFDGLTGTLGWTWQATGKLRVNTRLTRDTSQDSYAVRLFGFIDGTTDYSRITNGLRVGVDYAFSAKLGFNASVQQLERKLVRTLPPNPLIPTTATGTESYTVLSLGARWQPQRSVLLGCDVGKETRRGSGPLASDLGNERYGCYAQFTIQ